MNIVKVFHADHGITETTLRLVLAALKPSGFFASTIPLPAEHEPVLCALYGPVMGDDPVPEVCVTMKARTPDRPPSRLIPWSKRLTRELTVIGMADGENVTVYTAYGGKLAPREPGDVTLATEEERAEATAFWKTHALATETSASPGMVP